MKIIAERNKMSCLNFICRLNGTHLVTLVLDSEPISILCHFNLRDFGCGDGGWTPVMKMDGNKVTSAEYLSLISLTAIPF